MSDLTNMADAYYEKFKNPGFFTQTLHYILHKNLSKFTTWSNQGAYSMTVLAFVSGESPSYLGLNIIPGKELEFPDTTTEEQCARLKEAISTINQSPEYELPFLLKYSEKGMFNPTCTMMASWTRKDIETLNEMKQSSNMSEDV